MAIHKLKTTRALLEDIMSGKKTFEVRKDDRNYQVGDRLDLFEYDYKNERFTDAHCHRFVKYKLDGGQFGIEPGYCVMSLSFIEL